MGLVIDNFAGGGGASTGIEAALGRSVDYAINHNAKAIAMHRVNHPGTHHLTADVFDVNPLALTRGRRVGFGWFSPDCTFHSKARGGKPLREKDPARRRRGLAGVIPRWLSATGMEVFALENVEEFVDWGPLMHIGGSHWMPDPKRRGMLFRRWHRQIENIVSRQTGRPYRIDMRELKACDYGAGTTRKRLFVVGRADGGEIVFPEASHGHWIGAKPYVTAADCIDWSLPCPSIFERSRPLADATLKRIARGIMRYVVNNPQPFIVSVAHGDSGGRREYPASVPLGTISAGGIQHALVAPVLTECANASRPRSWTATEPLRTICAAVKGGHHALVTAFLAKHYTGVVGHGLDRPIGTITTVDHHSLVCAFLLKYYGTDQDPRLHNPLATITTKDRFGLVTVNAEQYRIVDIGMRMLAPHELYRAQGFDNYIIDHGIDDNGEVVPFTIKDQVQMVGNSVSPKVAEAIVRTNLIEQRQQAAA